MPNDFDYNKFLFVENKQESKTKDDFDYLTIKELKEFCSKFERCSECQMNTICKDAYFCELSDDKLRKLTIRARKVLNNVAPAKHGKWVENENFECGARRIHYDCSRCNRLGFTSSTELKPQEMYKYCPNCGAKMI